MFAGRNVSSMSTAPTNLPDDIVYLIAWWLAVLAGWQVPQVAAQGGVARGAWQASITQLTSISFSLLFYNFHMNVNGSHLYEVNRFFVICRSELCV